MLEGFMDSVRALTEIDTESFIAKASLQALSQKNEKGKGCDENATSGEIINLLNSAENTKPVATQINDTGEVTSASFFKKLGGIIKRMAVILLGRN